MLPLNLERPVPKRWSFGFQANWSPCLCFYPAEVFLNKRYGDGGKDLGSGKLSKITNFNIEKILNYTISRDGKKLLPGARKYDR